MTVLFDGSVDNAIKPPWAGIQAVSPSRIISEACPVKPADIHKWLRFECRSGDFIGTNHTKERTQLNGSYQLKNGDHRFVAFRVFFEKYNVPATAQMPQFNIFTQFIAGAVGQSPINFCYDGLNHGFVLQVTGNDLVHQHSNHYIFLPKFVAQGHTVDFCLETVVGLAGSIKLDVAVDGGKKQAGVPLMKCPTIYTDMVPLRPVHQIYRHIHPETDVIHIRPMIISDNYADVQKYFQGASSGW